MSFVCRNFISFMEPQETIKQNDKKMRAEYAVRRRRIKVFVWGVIIAILVGVLLYFAVSSYKKSRANIPGDTFSSVGQKHISLASEPPTPYNSNPPSSGGHFGSPANWAIYDYEANDKFFIHNLEHGGIWIAYRSNISQEALAQLKQFVEKYGGSKLVMTPRSANDADVAIVAWARVYKFNLEGEKLSSDQLEKMNTFYRAYKNRGPELVPDTMPGVNPKDMK